MTHKPESGIEPLIADWFRERYGGEAVDTQAYQSEPRWFPDIIVSLGWGTLFIEVENDADAVRDGVSQALGYAGADEVGGIPMVVTPAGHLDGARVQRLRNKSNCLIREFDDEAEEFVR